MKLNDAVFGALFVALGAFVLWRVQGFPPIPGQQYGAGAFPGVIGAGFVARLAGVQECMSLDIGGTSADVAIIVGGEPQYGIGERIGDFQIYIPSVSVSSIGEGGGSIAWVDGFGVLKVGPESAG